MTSTTLTSKGKYWQKRLRLQDWKITFVFEGAMEMDGAVGRCRFNIKDKSGTVYICKPSENTDSNPDNQNIDITLVHELLHLVHTPLYNQNPTDFEANAQEAAIELTAQAIVNAD